MFQKIFDYVAPVLGSSKYIQSIVFVIDKTEFFIFKKCDKKSFKYNKAIQHLIRKMMSLSITEQNINEYGRFDDLLITVDNERARLSLEKIYLKEIALWESNILVDKILRRFILQGGFDLKDINKEDRL